MNLISCHNLRRLTLFSAILLTSGIVLFFLSLGLSHSVSNEWVMVSRVGAFALLLTSPLFMLVNLILSILPGSRLKLEQCNH